MNKVLFTLLFTGFLHFQGNAQLHLFEFGLGAKFDKFKVDQTGNVFKPNIDMGAAGFLSYGRPISEKLSWKAGIYTNNYKVSFKVQGNNGIIYSSKEVVHVMRSNRLFLSGEYLTKRINNKITWANKASVSLIFGAKNPSDMVDQRSSEVNTATGPQSIFVNIRTFGKTGSSILLGANSLLYFQVNKDFKIMLDLGFVSGTGELTKIEMDYVEDSSSQTRKAILKNNGFSTLLTFGIQYAWQEEEK